MVDPDNEERLLKVPPHVVQDIKNEALQEAAEAIMRAIVDKTEINAYGAYDLVMRLVK